MRIFHEGREYTPKEWSDRFAVDLGGPSLTQQHLKDDADINVLMRRFGATGALPPAAAGAVYGDFSGIEEYWDAVEKVEAAGRHFMMLPPQVRELFGNEPGRLVEYARTASAEDFARLFKKADTPGGEALKPLPFSDASAQGAAVPRPEAEGSVS